MSLTQVIPSNFGYVALALSALPVLNMWQGILVGKYRKASGITYPQMYATPEQEKASKAALQLNCAQRSHGNTLENVPGVITTTLITGVLYPRFAAGALGIWIAGRIAYTLGYTTGDPKARMRGSFGYLGQLPLLIGSFYSAYRIITEGVF